MASPNVRQVKAKPDARPMRMALGAGGIAAFSALVAAIVVPANPAVAVPVVQIEQPTADPTGTPITIQRPIQYVQLKPGETAPPGATVIDPSGPKPTAVVISVPAPAAKQKPIIIRTTQSGKVIP